MLFSNLLKKYLRSLKPDLKLRSINDYKISSDKEISEEEDYIYYVKCVSCGTSRPLWKSDIKVNGRISPNSCTCGGKNEAIITKSNMSIDKV